MKAPPNSLYELRTGATYRSRFAYASGYTPLPDRNSFVPPALQERNRQFTELNGFKPGIQISNEGRSWPDFLFNGCGYISFFTSERVINDIRSEGIEILDVTEFPIESIESGGRTRLRIEDAPRYFVLEAYPELVPNWEAMRVPVDENGRPILTPRPVGAQMTPFLYRKDTWTGRDLVSDVRITSRLFGSERFRELAERKGWTNLRLERIGSHKICSLD